MSKIIKTNQALGAKRIVRVNEAEEKGKVDIAEIVSMVTSPEFIEGVINKLPSEVKKVQNSAMYESRFTDWVKSMGTQIEGALSAIGKKVKAGIKTANDVMSFLKLIAKSGLKKLSDLATKIIEAAKKLNLGKYFGAIVKTANSIASGINTTKVNAAVPSVAIGEGKVYEAEDVADRSLPLATAIAVTIAIVAFIANVTGVGVFGDLIPTIGTNQLTIGAAISGVATIAAGFLAAITLSIRAEKQNESVKPMFKRMIPTMYQMIKESCSDEEMQELDEYFNDYDFEIGTPSMDDEEDDFDRQLRKAEAEMRRKAKAGKKPYQEPELEPEDEEEFSWGDKPELEPEMEESTKVRLSRRMQESKRK